MSINKIETQYQNYAASGTSSTKNSSESTLDSFQKMMINLERRMKETLDKQRENDSKGSIQMSEKQWQKLMKKVDAAIDSTKDNIKEQQQEEKKQLEEKNLIRKDTVAVSLQTHTNSFM